MKAGFTKTISLNYTMGRKKLLLERFNCIADENIKADAVFSVFRKWLSEDECTGRVFCPADIESMDDFDWFRKVERQYLTLIVDLNKEFSICVIDWNSLPRLPITAENERKLSFNEMYREIDSHLNRDKLKLVCIDELGVFLLLSFDLTILLYSFSGVNIDPIKRVFEVSGFHQLELFH